MRTTFSWDIVGRVVLVIVGSVLIGGYMVYVRVPGVEGRVVDWNGRPAGNAVVEVGEKGGGG